ncbi:PTS galactitol transporter subunit IIC [Clostridia bacterium]|nr:PTS galactitol transporter subunit IIC [Clostridia bacterium]
MKTFDYTITDEIGIHARPAGLLVKEAKKFKSLVTVTLGEKTVKASAMALMGLGAKKGSTITVNVNGEDEDVSAATIETFLKENL